MKNKIKNYFTQFKTLMEDMPAWVLTMFVISIVCMNLFANKSVAFSNNWLALDCGIVFSWMSFLSMDIIVKHFGAKASIQVSLVATFISAVISVLFFLAALIPGNWGAFYDFGMVNEVNQAIDATVKGNWYIVFGSMVAFIVASITNSVSNAAIGKLHNNRDTYGVFVVRTYVSTTIGQFVDNFVFSLIVSQVLFGWTLLQCFVCAVTGALFELIFEAVFAPVGYGICQKWKRDNIGKNYLSMIN